MAKFEAEQRQTAGLLEQSRAVSTPTGDSPSSRTGSRNPDSEHVKPPRPRGTGRDDLIARTEDSIERVGDLGRGAEELFKFVYLKGGAVVNASARALGVEHFQQRPGLIAKVLDLILQYRMSNGPRPMCVLAPVPFIRARLEGYGNNHPSLLYGAAELGS
ncbi:Uu.00g070260.m01.CDS01 [Anthostomella pinea]|uniref:Uu.00g070260.m01.CDS01 n=1 Tax=Anthostomella pinea TaxID=933095 RepID=A0AAI8VUP5_9PEZI|nr:Uu.00g070260.m01.CDS01 [Anthostomella pinea]